MHDNPLNVLVVDDHLLVRMGVRQLLGMRAQPFVLHEAGSAREALDTLGRQACALVLLDIGLGSESGLAALPRLRALAPTTPVIVLSSMAEELYAERALQAGAQGYVMKSELATTLLEAVDAVLAGEVWLSTTQRSRTLRRLGAGKAVAPGIALSPRETEVLRLIAEGRSTREIAEALNRSVKTVETHKQALKDKLGADTPAMLVRKALAWFGEDA